MSAELTLLLTIGQEDAAGVYPVELCRVDQNGITPIIPASIDGAALEDPAATWTAERMREAVAAGVDAIDLEEIGRHLVSLLGPAGERWAELRNQQLPNTVVRTAFAIEPPELQLLPWEAAMVDGSFAFREATNPVCRAATPKLDTFPAPEPLPLRILVVIGGEGPANNANGLAWEEELRAMRSIFRAHRESVDVEVLISPPTELVTSTWELFRPHVFHFIGHGVRINDQSALRIWRDGKAYDWTVAEIIPNLESLSPVRFAFINACRTGDPGAQRGTYDIARTFIEKLGACSAITMLGDIRGQAAAMFSKVVYEGLVKLEPLDRVVAKARNNMGGKFGGDWTMPLLHLACSAAEVLPKAFDEHAPVADVRSEFTDLTTFVDRRNERRRVTNQLTEPEVDPVPKHLVVASGAEGAGKTALARWIARHLSLRGREARYVDFSKEEGKNFARVLELIRKGDKKSGWRGRSPLPSEPFAKFDEALAAHHANDPATEEFIGEMYAHFLDGLTAVAAAHPMVLVLDHFRCDGHASAIIGKHFEDYVWPLFLEPVAKGQVKNLTVLIVLAGKHNIDVLAPLHASAHPCEVQQWAKTEFPLLASEYVDDHAEKKPKFVELLIQAAALEAKEPWLPEELKRLRKTIEDYQ